MDKDFKELLKEAKNDDIESKFKVAGTYENPQLPNIF